MLQKLLTPLPFFHISFLWKTASNVHLKMKTIIFDRNLYILNGIVNCKHSTTTKNFWMNPFSIITKGGEGNLQIFDRMNFDFSLQINGGWRWVEQLFLSLSDERISSVFFATNNVSRCGTTQEIEKKIEKFLWWTPPEQEAATVRIFRWPI